MSAQRPLFDPSRIAGPSPPAAPSTITVSELTRLVKGALARHLPSTLCVVGELSNVSQPGSGHLYFTLKDDQSEVRGVMWRSAAAGLKFEPRDGLEVVVTGSVDVYEPRGQYQLYARRIEPRGVGALELAFRQLCEKLQREGLFDPARKKPLPRWPRRVAVVTSPTGAAVRDILKVLHRRFPCLEVFVYPVRVQGDGAAAEIAAAIAALNRYADQLGGIDVMIVGRGGGSLEDLWAFNEETVARAIFDSAIPVVSAVGHEVDVTVADLVADVRAPTPSAAAEIVTPVLEDVLAALNQNARRLARHVQHSLEVSRSRLDSVARRDWFRDPIGRLARYSQRIDEAAARLHLAVTRRLSAIRRTLHRCEAVVGSLRPEAYFHRKQRSLLELSHRLLWATRNAMVRRERRLAALADRLHAGLPVERLQHGRSRATSVQGRLDQSVRHRLAIARQQADGLAARLESVSYKRVLSRGYTITRLARRGAVVTSPEQVRPGDRLVTETAAGEFESRVLDARQPELFD